MWITKCIQTINYISWRLKHKYIRTINKEEEEYGSCRNRIFVYKNYICIIYVIQNWLHIYIYHSMSKSNHISHLTYKINVTFKPWLYIYSHIYIILIHNYTMHVTYTWWPDKSFFFFFLDFWKLENLLEARLALEA